MNPMDLLKIEFGSLKDLADKLNLKPNTVYLWGQSNIPFKYLKAIEELTDHKLTREMLRPDLYKKD
jgi:DNA-binding transcriptional regulator YdaS (Cro superfamily)